MSDMAQLKKHDSRYPILTFGGVNFINVPGATDVLQEVLEDDCYNYKRIPDESIVFDVGSFYGEFGLFCCKAKRCRVYGYEPSANSFMVNVINGWLNFEDPDKWPIYELHNEAIAGECGERDYWYRPNHPAGSGLWNYDGGTKSKVSCTTISSELDRLEIKESIVVKLDCEGAEREIFEKDPKWIDQASNIVMEWHNYDGHVYADILEGKGFKVKLSGSGKPPRPAYKKEWAGGLLWAVKK